MIKVLALVGVGKTGIKLHAADVFQGLGVVKDQQAGPGVGDCEAAAVRGREQLRLQQSGTHDQIVNPGCGKARVSACQELQSVLQGGSSSDQMHMGEPQAGACTSEAGQSCWMRTLACRASCIVSSSV